MDKIPITKVSEKVHQQKGFPSGPFNTCLTCKCGDNNQGGACCEKGVYVDYESYELILKHRDYLEKKVGIEIEKCFDADWYDETHFLGKKGIGTVTKDGTCVFRVRSGQGCEIVSYVLANDLPRRMIPSACRLYPITWSRGKLFLEKAKKNCVCIDKNNLESSSVFQTQKEEIDDIFTFENSDDKKLK